MVLRSLQTLMNVNARIGLAVLALVVLLPLEVRAEGGQCVAAARECEDQLRSILAKKLYLGVTLVPSRWGTTILEVDEKSPADHAGLESGDRIIGINGHDCRGKSPSQIKRYLNPKDRSRDLYIVVVRVGELLRLRAELSPLPQSRIEQIVASHLAEQHASQ